MIQPLHLNLLPLEWVFYFVAGFLLIINPILFLISYLLRYKTHPLINMHVGTPSKIHQGLPYGLTIYFRNDSVTPISRLFVDAHIRIGDNEIKQARSHFSLDSYGFKDVNIDYRESEILKSLLQKVISPNQEVGPSEEIRLSIQCYKARFFPLKLASLVNYENGQSNKAITPLSKSWNKLTRLLLFKKVGSHSYRWSLASREWASLPQIS